MEKNVGTVKYVRIEDVEVSLENGKITQCMLSIFDPSASSMSSIDITDYFKKAFVKTNLVKKDKKRILKIVEDSKQRKSFQKAVIDQDGNYEFVNIDKVFKL